MPFKRGYKASLPPFGKSDHVAIFLLPEWWSDQTEADLQDPLSDVDWAMF